MDVISGRPQDCQIGSLGDVLGMLQGYVLVTHGDQHLPAGMLFYVFFYNIIKVNYFLYHFIILLHLIFPFSLTRSSIVPYAYVSIESIDCNFLSVVEVKAIFLISSMKTLCLSPLKLCCIFNIDLLFLVNSL